MELNKQAAIEEESVAESNKLFIFFGGIAGSIGMPPYEFYRSAQILEHNKIFIRDNNQAWYQRGIIEIGNSPQALGEYIKQKTSRYKTEDIYFIGNSMGGFAALLFCSMLRCGSAIAFSPQTFLSEEKRKRHADDRWPDQIRKLHSSKCETDIYDLKPWIDSTNPEMRAKIHVSTSETLDEIHANELDSFPNIEVVRYPFGGHGLIKKLRDDGLLNEIIFR